MPQSPQPMYPLRMHRNIRGPDGCTCPPGPRCSGRAESRLSALRDFEHLAGLEVPRQVLDVVPDLVDGGLDVTLEQREDADEGDDHEGDGHAVLRDSLTLFALEVAEPRARDVRPAQEELQTLEHLLPPVESRTHGSPRALLPVIQPPNRSTPH